MFEEPWRAERSNGLQTVQSRSLLASGYRLNSTRARTRLRFEDSIIRLRLWRSSSTAGVRPVCGGQTALCKRLADKTLKTTGLSLALDCPERLGSRVVHVRLLGRSLTGRKVTLRRSRRPTDRRCMKCLCNGSETHAIILSLSQSSGLAVLSPETQNTETLASR